MLDGVDATALGAFVVGGGGGIAWERCTWEAGYGKWLIPAAAVVVVGCRP